MKDLFTTFSVEQIILFIIMFAIAMKGLSSWFDWAQGKFSKIIDKTNQKKEINNKITELMHSQKEMESEVENCQIQIKQTIERLEKSINLLLGSDKDDIKAWITEKHHYFCYKLGYIDDYNLDCIEKRYHHYEDEGGNSFVHDLMEEIRALPRKSGVYIYKNNEEDK